MKASGQEPAKHHELLNQYLEGVINGTCSRLMVQMPPGSAKSTYCSILFPAYFLGRSQRGQIIATSHTASLAKYFGYRVRRVVDEQGERLGVAVEKGAQKTTEFCTTNGGEYFAAGLKGPITGRRADLIIIDDPIKSWAQAESSTFRDAAYDWYRGELCARLKPGGRVVLVMTRWHEDDLAGRLKGLEDSWTQLSLPAIAGENDPLGRDIGQVLWPEWQSQDEILKIRHEVGERVFAALYQQDPKPRQESIFQIPRINVLPEAPQIVRAIRAWDLAATSAATGKNPDFTVGLKLGCTRDEKLVVVDVVRFQAEPGTVEARIQETARLDGPATVIALPQDPGQAGAAQVSFLTRGLVGFQIHTSPERGAKVLRAMAAASQVNAGNLSVLGAPWNDAFFAELRAFPDSLKDDQVDALSRAVNTLATTPASQVRRLQVPLLKR